MASKAAVSFGFLALVMLAGEPFARAQGDLPVLESPEDLHARLNAGATAPPAPTPFEPSYAPFGSQGQLVLTNAWVASLTSTQFDGSQASSISGGVDAGFDYFLVRNLSIGLEVDFNAANQQGYGADSSLVDTTTTSFTAGARVGYNVPFSRTFSLYPRATFGVEWAEQNEQLVSGTSVSVAGSATGGQAVTQTGPYVNLYAPLLFHVAPHFYLGLGPSIFRDFGKAQGGPDVGAERTRLGVGLELGGYVGGAPVPAPAPTVEPRGPARRFGDAGEFVIWGDVETSAFWTTYDGTSSSNTSVSITPGVDYFVVDHVSIGLGTSFGYSNVKGLDGTMTVTTTRTSFSLSPRVGVDIPLGRLFSVYARANMYFGYESEDEDDLTGSNDDTQGFAGVGLYAPLLLHVAPHLFVGFGPSVSHDLTHSYAYPNGSVQNRATTLDAGLVVGGWL